MKKIILLLLLLSVMLSACSMETQIPESTVKNAGITVEDEVVKSVWFTYYELSPMMKNKDESKCKKAIDAAFKKVKDMGFNTVTVQVRPFADALYDSNYFPSSEYAVNKQGDALDFDPLSIMCEMARKHSLRIEAWVNPYRIRNDNDIEKLSSHHIAKVWYQNKKTKTRIYRTKKGIYFNPASDEVTKLIVNGVKEIVSNYAVDAVHMDDYFYPTTDKEIDALEYEKEKDKLSLGDFRRNKVSNMIKSVYTAVKSVNSAVKFGISPASDIRKDTEELYADVGLWVRDEGYCDYICPQVYFGFRNVNQPFMFTVKKWVGMTNCDLYVGLPLYKAGRADKYAAQNDKSIINEFKNHDNIIARQITYLSKLDEVKGFYIFSYSSLSDEKCQKEVENILKVMR